MNLSIRKCGCADLTDLQEIATETFSAAFSKLNTAETMEKYLKDAFNPPKLLAELKNRNSNFYFVYCNDVLAGYIKLNEFEAQTDIKESDSFEIERIYVKSEYSGKGIGARLIEYAIEQAKLKNKKYIWLGVWEKNTDAIRFYKHNGFYESGKHIFVMGDEKQTDLIMKKNVDILKRELRKISPDVRVSPDQIKEVLLKEVLKREVIEGEKADEAKKKINKILSRNVKSKNSKPLSKNIIEENTLENNENKDILS